MLLVKWESWYGRFPARNRCEISFHTDDNIHPSKIIVNQRWNFVRNSREQKSAKINFFFSLPSTSLRRISARRNIFAIRGESNHVEETFKRRHLNFKCASNELHGMSSPFFFFFLLFFRRTRKNLYTNFKLANVGKYC